MGVSLGELAVRFGCELRGDPDAQVERVATLAHADAGSLTFLANPRYRSQLAATRATAVVLSAAAADECPTAMLVSADPYATYARIAALLHPLPALVPGVHPSAIVAPGARIEPKRAGGPARGHRRRRDGRRALLHRPAVRARCGRDARRGRAPGGPRDARPGVQLGARTVVQPGAVIGGDGFGFAPVRGTWLKVPQIGAVRVGADVEIGANTTIDRGALGDTVLEEGVKLDNLIMIAHNVRIGAHTAIAACTGVSGSTTIGRRCMIGGHVGFAGHISIADDVHDHRLLDDQPLDRACRRILERHSL